MTMAVNPWKAATRSPASEVFANNPVTYPRPATAGLFHAPRAPYDLAMHAEVWNVSRSKSLDLSRPGVMAILNLTPDSFSDGGKLPTSHAIIEAATRAIEAGASVLDVGGESTRPGAARVSEQEQVARVVPAIGAIRSVHPGIAITVDTTRASVAAAALDAGADGVNDVSGGDEDPDMLDLVASRGSGIILMHRLTTPEQDSFSDQYSAEPRYAGQGQHASGVVEGVCAYLRHRLRAAQAAGIRRESIVLDPGLGFGKSVEQNLELIGETHRLKALGRPILSGLSRKSFVGRVGLGRDSTPKERLAPTLAMSVMHFHAGARLFRVHDVAEHVAALRAAAGVLGSQNSRQPTVV